MIKKSKQHIFEDFIDLMLAAITSGIDYARPLEGIYEYEYIFKRISYKWFIVK